MTKILKGSKLLSTENMTFCALFTALIAVGAFIKIPIPVTPFTLQFLFTNLAGLLLGKSGGFTATIIYIALGLMGLPIFSSGGGLGYIFNPTFGYLLGFAAGAWVAGFVIQKAQKKDSKTLLIASFLNLTVVYLFGMVYYYLISNYYLASPIGIKELILYCFVLAVPGDIALCILSAFLSKRLFPVINKGGIL